jgi:hypothetical protein
MACHSRKYKLFYAFAHRLKAIDTTSKGIDTTSPIGELGQPEELEPPLKLQAAPPFT